MRALLEGVSARVDTFQDITQKSLAEARERISHVSSNTHMQEALGKDRMNQTQQYSKMVNHIERRMKSECAISRSHATNASKTLSDVLENHCRADGGHHFRWESSANCDRAAGDIEPLSNRHHANGSGFSISCPPKAVAGYDTEASFSAMETALRRWNHSKPAPNLTNVRECNDRGVSGPRRHTEPCTVLEAWLRDYEKTRYSIKRLYDITRTAMGMRRYAERLLNDGKQAIEQQKQRERDLEEERARQQEAMQREAAAMKVT
ncbi:unnamed protein product [Trypanosoma congolense IL3000]|uniref:WGS project CAEQ00000000 data, annotated contig 1090 n=1 Tax=Trypanosoma congolense (strain IL3000) TaxID=1068625 RepID=F9W3Q3_TRYCI|nr:unnamed protein product [Trypanosoma congolense IL3000]